MLKVGLRCLASQSALFSSPRNPNITLFTHNCLIIVLEGALFVLNEITTLQNSLLGFLLPTFLWSA